MISDRTNEPMNEWTTAPTGCDSRKTMYLSTLSDGEGVKRHDNRL